MNVKACIWWILFFCISIIFQASIPSLDALVIGLILVLQEKRYKDLLWLLPLLIFIQEGIGSRDFGGMLLWYAIVVILFIIGRWLFEVQNMLFVMLMAVCLGSAHFVLVYMLAPLQDLPVNLAILIEESIYQAIFVAPAWWIAHLTRKWIKIHVDAV